MLHVACFALVPRNSWCVSVMLGGPWPRLHARQRGCSAVPPADWRADNSPDEMDENDSYNVYKTTPSKSETAYVANRIA